ncbi:hypothetical protein AABD45_05785 [Vibrio vulnificus]|uniref:hypothetical protein n=1 Tax=Vibrio vulnificus TaxID=672 RepID=UPI003256980C
MADKTEKPKIKLLIEPTGLNSRLPENRLRQLSEFPAPKNKSPKNSALKSQLADKHQTENLREKENHKPLILLD